MFSRCYRDDTMWYGLPDVIGMPKTNAEIASDASNDASNNIYSNIIEEYDATIKV